MQEGDQLAYSTPSAAQLRSALERHRSWALRVAGALGALPGREGAAAAMAAHLRRGNPKPELRLMKGLQQEVRARGWWGGGGRGEEGALLGVWARKVQQ